VNFNDFELAQSRRLAVDLVRAAKAAQFEGDEMSSREWHENAVAMTAAVLRALGAQAQRLQGDEHPEVAAMELIASDVEAVPVDRD
jgi:hypothetical protein